MNALEISMHAANIAAEIAGRKPEGVSRCERRDTGWQVVVEVLEQKAMISDNDVLATYQLEFDRAGELMGYERSRRYQRGKLGGQFAA